MTDVTPPPAPQTPAVPATASAEVAAAETPVAKKGSGVGIASLLLALLAVIADLAIIVFAVISVASIVSNFDASSFEVSSVLAALGGAAVLAAIGFFGGIVVALLALLLGIIAIAKNRGRVAGVFGLIFSILVLVTHGSVILAIAQSGAALTGLVQS